MDAGELVPDEVVLGLVREILGLPAADGGFILDGFPRTVAQAEGLEVILDERGVELDAVVYLDVPEEELVRRLSGRRVCAACGAVYNVYTDPPSVAAECDRCGGRLEIREDDREETVRNRLRVYRESTEPVLEWYRESPTSLRELTAVGSVAEVHDRLLGALGCS
jgi:adenylate kinase